MKTLANNEKLKAVIESGKYEIRRDGTVLNKKTQREVGYTSKSTGYRMLTVNKNQKVQIHRLIFAIYGNEPLSDVLVINHIDGDKTNNCIDNLEQVTEQKNLQHTYRVLGHPPVIGNSKLTKKKADRIRQLHAKGWSYNRLVDKFGVSKTTIAYVVEKRIWK